MRSSDKIFTHQTGAAALAAAALLSAGIAGAATIDYDALEELFGEPVTDSATGSPQRESDVAATMVIITAEDIRRSGARDIPGVLRSVPGINILQTSNDHADVSVRGYNQTFSPRLLVLVDGRQVYADYYSFTPWSTVPVELAAIRQIEVVKGPNSALFGFNAVGGVINIVTYDPIDDDVDVVSLSGGTQALIQGSAVSTWKIGNSAGVRLSAGHRQNDDFSTPLPPADAGARRGNERTSLNLNAGMELAANVRIGLDATYSDAQQAEFSPIHTLSYGEYQTNSIKGRITADTGIGLLEASVYSNGIENSAHAASLSDGSLSFENRVTVAQVQGISKVGSRHTVRLSAEYRDDSMETTPIGGAEVFYDVAAIGSMWEWQIDPTVTLTSAVRLDHWSLGRSGDVPAGYGLTNDDWNRSETEPSFNAGVVWQATDADTLRLLIGRGVQLPSLLNLGGLVLPLNPFGYASGVPDLAPVVVDNYELSWDRTLSSMQADLRVSAFYGHSHDLVTFTGGFRPAAGLFSIPVNVGDSRTSGLEVSLYGTLRDEWRWGFSYKHQDIDDTFNPIYPVETTSTDFEHTTPRHVAKASAGWTRGRWTVDGYLHYQSDFSGILADLTDPTDAAIAALTPISDYLAVDGRVGFAISDTLDLALSGRNLTRSEQRQTAAPEVERAVFATLSFNFGRSE